MPRKVISTLKKDISNKDLINVARKENHVFADMVPEATSENIREVAQSMLSNSEYINEFFGTLMNRIGRTMFNNRSWKNILAKFKQGMLTYGEITQEIFVNKVREDFYDLYDSENTQFSIAIPDVRAVYYEMNSQKYYQATINESMIRQAFLSENGLISLVDAIITRMAQQDEVYEFECMKKLFKDYATKGKFKAVTVSAVSDETTAKALIKSIKEYFGTLKFVSNKYNYVGVDTHTPAEDFELFITTALDAQVDVDVLAKAFNMEKTDFVGHLNVLDNLGGIDGAVAILVDRAWFRTYDNKVDATRSRNAKGLYDNHFLHHWETFAVNPFANAVLFTTKTPSITSLVFVDNTGTEEDEFDMTAGQTRNIGTKLVSANQAQTTIIFEVVSGADKIAELTSTGSTCMIKTKSNASTGDTIVIKAVSMQDPTKTDTATITIVDPS